MRAPRSNGPPQLAPPMNLIGWPKTIQPCAVTLAAKSMVMAYRANWTHATTSTMVCSTGCSESSPPNVTIHMHAAILAMKIVRSASARNANACSAGCGEAPVHGGSAATAVSSRIGVAEKECTSVVDAALRRAGDRCRRRDAASGIVILALLKRGTAVCVVVTSHPRSLAWVNGARRTARLLGWGYSVGSTWGWRRRQGVSELYL